MGMTRTNAIKILKKLELEVEGKTREEVNEMIRQNLGWVFDKNRQKIEEPPPPIHRKKRLFVIFL